MAKDVIKDEETVEADMKARRTSSSTKEQRMVEAFAHWSIADPLLWLLTYFGRVSIAPSEMTHSSPHVWRHGSTMIGEQQSSLKCSICQNAHLPMKMRQANCDHRVSRVNGETGLRH